MVPISLPFVLFLSTDVFFVRSPIKGKATMRKVTTIMQAASDFYESVSTVPINVLYLRASLCKILISSFAHKMDFAHNLSVDFF